MIVSVNKESLPGFSRDSLMLLDPTCKAGENGTHWLFGAPLHGCGTRRRYLNSAVVYSNKVRYGIQLIQSHAPSHFGLCWRFSSLHLVFNFNLVAFTSSFSY
ncbi:MAG: zona pellucida domain-containing protein, partial [bacterium]|nr:zona pellucida domain-containing protein [bacterium]